VSGVEEQGVQKVRKVGLERSVLNVERKSKQVGDLGVKQNSFGLELESFFETFSYGGVKMKTRYSRIVNNHRIQVGVEYLFFTVIPTIRLSKAGTKSVSVEWLFFYATLSQVERPDEYYFPVFGNH